MNLEMFLLRSIFCLNLYLFPFLLGGQTSMALELRNNVVAIESKTNPGFGVITGENSGKLYIATTAHIIAPDTPAITIKFYDNYTSFEATLLKTYDQFDLALLEVDKPRGFSWKQDCLGKARVGDMVSFIGRNGIWYVARGSALGTINKQGRNHLDLDITSVEPGTSGAPIINESGIVGMILSDDNSRIEALKMVLIKDIFSEYSYFFTMKSVDNGIVKSIDGKPFTFTEMKDDRVWLTQDLTVDIEGAHKYNDNLSRGKYLYTWGTAKIGCTMLGEDWRLPTDAEWHNLISKYGGYVQNQNTGIEEKERIHPKEAYKALRHGEFSAFLGGVMIHNGTFEDEGDQGVYWTASSDSNGKPICYTFNKHHGKIYRHINRNSGSGRAVRCIKASY